MLLPQWQQVQVPALDNHGRLIVLVFMAGHQIYEFSKVVFRFFEGWLSRSVSGSFSESLRRLEPRLWEGIGVEAVEVRKGVLKENGSESRFEWMKKPWVTYGEGVGNPGLLDGVTGEASMLNELKLITSWSLC